MDDEFPDTYLPRVARAADRAMQEVLDEDQQIARFLKSAPLLAARPRYRPAR